MPNPINKPPRSYKTLSESPADESLAKDAQTLLGLGVGDKRILEQIHRAAVNGELISNHERAYVDSLLEKHAAGPAEDAPAPGKARERPPPAPTAAPARSSSKTIAIAAGAAVAAIAVAVALLSLPGGPGGAAVDTDPEPVLTVGVDLDEYGAGDFILVEGLSGGGAVDVHIVGPSGQVWRESILPDADGSFHTIALAGSGGWSAGTYTVRAVHGDQTYESAFDFRDS